MFRKKIMRFASFLLVFVMAAMLIGAGSAPAYALVGVDDAAFLYTLWSAFGLKAGVDITTIGGDAFTQDAITGLYNEWQNSRVSSGVQAAVSTLADFVSNVLKVGTLVNPGSAASGTLYTVLSLSAEVTEKLGQFWNWLIVDKLGGTSVDAVDFQQGSGNLGSLGNFVYCPVFVDSSIRGFYAGSWNTIQIDYYSNRSNIVLFGISGTTTCYAVSAGDSSGLSDSYVCCRFARNGNLVDSSLKGSNGIFYPDYNVTVGVTASDTGQSFHSFSPDLPLFPSFADGLNAVSSFFGGTGQGSLTVAPDAGVDVLGFPDTGAQDYVPADTNIAINIPYDSTADLSDYIASGYDLALENDLAVGVPEGVIEGTGTVGPVGDYVVPGLADVFPFCIPFDIYNFLEALAADPEAPHFTATLEFPEAVGGAQQIDIDFDNPTFNTLASILRTLELLAFCVGLAFVTRSFFIRG